LARTLKACTLRAAGTIFGVRWLLGGWIGWTGEVLLAAVRWLLAAIGRLLLRIGRLLLVVLLLGWVLIRVLVRRSAVALVLRRGSRIVWASLGCVVGLRRILLAAIRWLLMWMALALSAVIVVV
jgi:hypothetical protein